MTLASLMLRHRVLLVKEVFDRVMAFVGLLIFGPVLLILAAAIKISSPGPAFYVQRRVGRGGEPFGIIKLRTMIANAEKATGPIWAQDNDPRITRLGRFLRFSHLDEVPQLLNVLKGEMSLVGPRPERPVFVEQFRHQIPNYEQRLKVKPGITGLAQVSHHYDSTLRDVRKKLLYDLLYIRKMCLMVDIAILLLTFLRLTGRALADAMAHETGPASVPNAFSVDVEDYYQVLNFQRRLSRSDWDSYPSRVVDNTCRILDLLDARGVRGTFFTLGLVAEQHPDLVPEIAARGHEVASHGWSHTPIHGLDRGAFHDELVRSRRILSEQSGQDVIGFRAPSFSVTPKTRWALDVLLDAGYRYDSSMFPVKHPDYGMPDLPLAAHVHETESGRQILELPMTVAPFLGRNVPVSGGGYFRLLPFGVTRWGLSRVNRAGRSAVFYLHPWEVDPDQPDLRDKTSRLGAFRHYTNLSRTYARLERLLDRFSFTTCAGVLEHAGLLPSPSPTT